MLYLGSEYSLVKSFYFLIFSIVGEGGAMPEYFSGFRLNRNKERRPYAV